MRRIIVITVTLIAGLCCTTPTQAGFMLIPVGLNPGDQFRVAFLSSDRRSGTSSNVADYDQFVADLAAAAGLDTYYGTAVTWRALVSTPDVSAISRLPAASPPIYRTDGVLLATSGADLWDGSIANPINWTESGVAVLNLPTAWTGTNSDGASNGQSLGNSLFIRTVIGDSFRISNGLWVQMNTDFPFNRHRVYGFSSVLTVPSDVPDVPAVPEPASSTLAWMGLAGLAFGAVRRRFTFWGRGRVCPAPSPAWEGNLQSL